MSKDTGRTTFIYGPFLFSRLLTLVYSCILVFLYSYIPQFPSILTPCVFTRQLRIFLYSIFLHSYILTSISKFSYPCSIFYFLSLLFFVFSLILLCSYTFSSFCVLSPLALVFSPFHVLIFLCLNPYILILCS